MPDIMISTDDIKEEIRLMLVANQQSLDHLGGAKEIYDGCEWACKCFSGWVEDLEAKCQTY